MLKLGQVLHYWYDSTQEACHPGYSRCPCRSKRKGKNYQSVEPEDRRPNLSDVNISDAEDSHSNIASPQGMQGAEPGPILTTSNSTRCFPSCGSRWRTSKQWWSDSASQPLMKRCSDSYPDATTQTSRGPAEVAIFPYCKRKCMNSLITTAYPRIRAFHH